MGVLCRVGEAELMPFQWGTQQTTTKMDPKKTRQKIQLHWIYANKTKPQTENWETNQTKDWNIFVWHSEQNLCILGICWGALTASVDRYAQ